MTDDVSPPSVTQMTTSPPDAPVLELEPADERKVLETLERRDQGPVPARHLADEPVFDVLGDRGLRLRPDLVVALDLLQKGLQNALSICLASRPVAPQP